MIREVICIANVLIRAQLRLNYTQDTSRVKVSANSHFIGILHRFAGDEVAGTSTPNTNFKSTNSPLKIVDGVTVFSPPQELMWTVNSSH
jgi:hypothetical protein